MTKYELKRLHVRPEGQHSTESKPQICHMNSSSHTDWMCMLTYLMLGPDVEAVGMHIQVTAMAQTKQLTDRDSQTHPISNGQLHACSGTGCLAQTFRQWACTL